MIECALNGGRVRHFWLTAGEWDMDHAVLLDRE